MSSPEDSGSPSSQSDRQEDSKHQGLSGDQNTVQGGATNGGFIFQGGQHQIEVTQYFGGQPPTKDLNSPFANETIETEYWEPETILIPEGSFWLGSDAVGTKDYEKRHEVSLPIYRMSKYPVLNREYAEFITRPETEISPPLMGFSGLNPKDGLEDQPVKGVTLEDARAYCKWLSEMTKRKYDVPNEAQLEKACQGPYGCSDIVEDIYLWTCTLWGENPSPPEYRYPWKKDDGRNNPNANSQIRRVVCRYKKAAGADKSQRDSRSGQFPKKPLSPERYSFRVVMNF